MVPYLGGGGYNGISQPGDVGIFAGPADLATGIVIADWSSSGIGMRLSGTELVLHGNLTVTGTLDVQNGKNFVQVHPTDPTKEIVFVALEGPESGTYCRGTASLRAGVARVTLPESFALVTEEGGLTAQITPLGKGHGLYIDKRTRTELVVACDDGASCPKQFDWMVNGVRAGFANHVAIRPRTMPPAPVASR